MEYEKLLMESDETGISVKEKSFDSSSRGLINGRKIAINKKIHTAVEKSCVLAEELGHYHTSVGDIIDLTDTVNSRQEYRARLWAYDKQIGLIGIINAYENHCGNFHDMAEYLNVTESFLVEALECYKNKYGNCKKIDNYLICFEPYFCVVELH